MGITRAAGYADCADDALKTVGGCGFQAGTRSGFNQEREGGPVAGGTGRVAWLAVRGARQGGVSAAGAAGTAGVWSACGVAEPAHSGQCDPCDSAAGASTGTPSAPMLTRLMPPPATQISASSPAEPTALRPYAASGMAVWNSARSRASQINRREDAACIRFSLLREAHPANHSVCLSVPECACASLP